MTGDRIRELIEELCTVNEVPEIIPNFEIEWSKRLTSTAGRCHTWLQSRKFKLVFSSKLFAVATPEQQLDNVVHEICHAIANYKMWGNAGHGPYWREAVRVAGYTPHVYHNIDNSHVR